MSETEPEVPKSRPHGLAVREDFTGTVERAEQYPYHAATYDCKCGIGYRIFVDQIHYRDAQRFHKYVVCTLENLHTQNAKHSNIIQIPMEAEFSA